MERAPKDEPGRAMSGTTISVPDMPFVRAGRQRAWSLSPGLLLAERFILDRPAVESIRCATWHAYDRATDGQVAVKVFDNRFDATTARPRGSAEFNGPAWWRPQVPIEELRTEIPRISQALGKEGVAFHGSFRHRSLLVIAWDWHTQTSIWTQALSPPLTAIKDVLGIGLHISVDLTDLHALKLCHGNIKPTSLIIRGDGKILLGDHLSGRARQPRSLDLRPSSSGHNETLNLNEAYDVYMLVTTLMRLAGVQWEYDSSQDWDFLLRDFRRCVEGQFAPGAASNAVDVLEPVLRFFDQVLDVEQATPAASELESVLGTAVARMPAPNRIGTVAPVHRQALSAVVGPGRIPLSTGTFICVGSPLVLPEKAARAFEDESLFAQPPLEVVDVLGWGGFALVYRCFWHNIGRMVAAKELYPRSVSRTPDGSLVASDPDWFDRLKTASYAWEGLNCAALTGNIAFIEFYERESGEVRFPLFPADPPPTIVPTLWAFPSHDTVMIITELAPGISLRELVADFGPVDAGTALQIMITMLENLTWLQDFGVVHHDCSPSNVVVDPVWGHAYLLDFGLAGAAASDPESPDTDLTEFGRLVKYALGGSEHFAGAVPARERRLYELIAQMCNGGPDSRLSLNDVRSAIADLEEEFANHPTFANRSAAQHAGSLCGGWRRFPGLKQPASFASK